MGIGHGNGFSGVRANRLIGAFSVTVESSNRPRRIALSSPLAFIDLSMINCYRGCLRVISRSLIPVSRWTSSGKPKLGKDDAQDRLQFLDEAFHSELENEFSNAFR